MNINPFLFILLINQVKSQNFIRPTALDGFFQQYRQVLNIVFDAIGRNSEDPKNLARARSLKLLQEQVPLSVKFPCNVTGFRSLKPPTNVNEVRPGDIDVIAALGDSLSVGNGLVATNIMQVLSENRGLAWSIGGQGTWREYLTLPNILKEFNPNLFGFSLSDSLSSQKESQFNPAEFAAFSSELPYMTKILIQRMKSDPRVDLKNHWKLITVMIGTNNFCLDMCFQPYPELILKYHRNDLLSTFRILKENLPRTVINLVSSPDASQLTRLKGKPAYCQLMNSYECMCILQQRFANQTSKFGEIIKRWQQMEEEIANMDEFNTKDFAILYQPFTLKFKIPRLSGNNVDISYLSQDCYHPSQKLNAEGANALWNNMMEKHGNKSMTNFRLFERFLCPSEKEPYIFTKMNSIV